MVAFPNPSPNPLTDAAEIRRREAPTTIAVAVLTGGLAAAILGGAGPVLWAACMSALIVADAELHRRLDLAGVAFDRRLEILLAGWAFAISAVAASLPAALWLSGQAAGAAAAIVLWVAGVVRCFNGGSGSPVTAFAGAAPPALSLLTAPFFLAAQAARPDWGLALIATVGGGALMVYVAHARARMVAAERALRDAARAEDHAETLARLMLARSGQSAALFDANGRVLAESAYPHQTLDQGLLLLWRAARARVEAGEVVRRDEEKLAIEGRARWFAWEARPWRDDDGAVIGMLAFAREVTALVEARRAGAEALQPLAKSA